MSERSRVDSSGHDEVVEHGEHDRSPAGVRAMRQWGSVLAILGGIVATVGAALALDLLYACAAALATVTFAASTPSVVRSNRVPDGAERDPRALRAWRAAHPGTTISEAIAAVSER